MCVNISALHPLFFPSFLLPFFFVFCFFKLRCKYPLCSPCPPTPPGTLQGRLRTEGALQRRRDYLLSISADDLPEDVLESGGGGAAASGGARRRRSGLANTKKGHFHTSCRQQRKPPIPSLPPPGSPRLVCAGGYKSGNRAGFAFSGMR